METPDSGTLVLRYKYLREVESRFKVSTPPPEGLAGGRRRVQESSPAKSVHVVDPIQGGRQHRGQHQAARLGGGGGSTMDSAQRRAGALGAGPRGELGGPAHSAKAERQEPGGRGEAALSADALRSLGSPL
jgi:hypothetical protein